MPKNFKINPNNNKKNHQEVQNKTPNQEVEKVYFLEHLSGVRRCCYGFLAIRPEKIQL